MKRYKICGDRVETHLLGILRID